MSLIEGAIAANRKNAKNHDPSLANKPAPKVAILTCMDPRLNELLEWLDIKPADADVIRNVGTAATGDVVRSHVFDSRSGRAGGHDRRAPAAEWKCFRKKSSRSASIRNAACGP